MKTPISSARASRFPLTRALVAALGLLALPSIAHATAVTSWTQFSGSVSSGLNTSSPVLGNGTTDSGDNQSIYSIVSSPYTLTTTGDSLTFSGAVTFTNLATPQADQFKFGLYNTNSQPGATGWLGYMASNSGTSGGPTYSRLWERDNPNTGSFGSGTGATVISNVNATPSNTAFASGSYTFSLTLARVATGLDITWTLTGTNVTYSVSKTFTDTTPQTYTFNSVGLFTGGGLNSDQVSFSNLDTAFTSAVPEPATWGVITACFALGAVCLRRRARA